MSDYRCRLVQTSLGVVRVNGPIGPEPLQALVEAAAARLALECGHVGPIPMPAIAQRMHGRETYACGLDKGHAGPHEWHGRTWPAEAFAQ